MTDWDSRKGVKTFSLPENDEINVYELKHEHLIKLMSQMDLKYTHYTITS